MTSRERELTAIRQQVPDRIPADRICIETIEVLAAYLGVAPTAVEDELGIDGRLVAPAFTSSPTCRPRTPSPSFARRLPSAGKATQLEGDAARVSDAEISRPGRAGRSD
ncbi:MAG: hypothetical protein FJ291_03070 [Planctomycetes bacterium]|nr:hypothetical protein [Planctomycetota bacterium]